MAATNDALMDALGVDDLDDLVIPNSVPEKLVAEDTLDDLDDVAPTSAPTRDADDLSVDVSSAVPDDDESRGLVAGRAGDVHFVAVRSTIKGGVHVKLGPLTAIVGENAQGKTAVLDSLRLLVTGKHPVGPHPADLLRLGGGDELRVEGVVNDGSECSFTVEPGDGGRPKVTHEPPAFLAGLTNEQYAGIIPTDAVMEVLQAGTRRSREQVFARWGVALTYDPPDGLDKDQKELWATTIASFQKEKRIGKIATHSEYAELPTLLRSKALEDSAAIRADESAQKARRKEAREIGLAVGRPITVVEAELEAARAWERGAGLRKKLVDAAAELDVLRATAVRLGVAPVSYVKDPADVAQVATYEAELKALSEFFKPIELRFQRMRLLQGTIELSLMGDGSKLTCGTCGTDHDREVLSRRLSAVEVKITKLAKEVATKQGRWTDVAESLHALRTEMTDDAAKRANLIAVYERDRQDLKRDVEAVRNRVKTTEEALQAIGVTTDEAPTATVEQLEAEATSTRRIVALRDAIEREAGEIKKANRALEDLKVLEREAGKAVQEWLKVVRGRAEKAVNTAMPAGLRAELVLESPAEKDICEWSVIGRDGKPHNRHTASGSEFGALFVAYAVAAGAPAPYRLLPIDDDVLGRLSPTRLRAFLAILADAVRNRLISQVVIAWTRPEELVGLTDWQIVEV